MADDVENLLLIEKSLIRGKWDAKISESSLPSIQLAKLVVECRFREVLKSQQALSLFRLSSDNVDLPFEDVLIGLASSKTTAASMSEELTRLVLAIAFLHAFIQANWTGPDINIHPSVFFTNDNGVWTEELIHTKSVQELAHGGEPAYHLSKVPIFLRFAQILVSLPYKYIHSISLWRLRVASVHLQVLDDMVALYEDFHVSLQPLLITFASEADLSGRIHLELGILEHLLTRDKLAAEHFVKAARCTELEYELSGALGKRTKFQVTEVAQLVLLAESHLKTESDVAYDSESGVKNNVEETLPETLALNDDTLLEQTEFTSSRPGKSGSLLNHINPSCQPFLHPLDQCILISLCLNIRNTSPLHGLTTEQMHPYVSRVISQPKNWSVHTMALLLRSRLESSRTRTVERSTLQLQALIDQMSSSDSTTCERLLCFHTILLPPKWELERELAQRYLSLGVVKSALEIFERLEMWEDVIKCYGALQMPEKGIAIVRDLLEGKKGAAAAITSRREETLMPPSLKEDATRQAKLLCLLGDLEPANAIGHYEKAWFVSNETSGRAMRSLGGYYFAQAKYREAIECLRKALKINPLFEKTWFILGCTCMRIEDWEEAKNAFGRCVAINEEDGESWNNLASMYLRMGETLNLSKRLSSSLESLDKMEDNGIVYSKTIPFENKLFAFRALKQSLRHSYENWRIWYNYMIVSLDVGEIQEACRALSRLIELTADKAGPLVVDEDVLDRLVNAVTRAPPSFEDSVAENTNQAQNPNEGHGLYRSVLQLLKGTILPRMSSPRIFRAYARLLSWRREWEDAIKAYLDAYRCDAGQTTHESETELEKWRAAVGNVEEIVDILRNFGPKVEGYKWRLQARSIIRTFTSRSRDFEDEPEWERVKLLQEDLCKDER